MSCVARGLSLVAGGAVSARPAEVCAPAKAGARTRVSATGRRFARTGPLPSQGNWHLPQPTALLSPSCSPRTRATAAGPVSCSPSSTRDNLCCGSRSAWRSSNRADPSARPAGANLIHVEARDARDALWAMEEGLRCAALSAVIGELWGDPRALDFTATRRLAVAAERSRRAVLAGAARRYRQPQRRADALADRERAIAGQSARRARAGSAGVGCRAVPRARLAAGPLDIAHEADRFHLVAASGDRALGEGAATYRLTAPVVLTVEGTHGPIIHAVTRAAASAARGPARG